MTSKEYFDQFKITEPNYTQIPNILFDYWMRRLSPEQFMVLLYIAYKEFGWDMTCEELSLSQIAEGTGVSRGDISLAMKKLEDVGLIEAEIIREEHGDTIVSFNMTVES